MPLTLTDNTTKTFSLSEYKSGLPNLRKIANKTIGDLQTESGILIFPPKVEDTDDDIKDHVIFNLTEDDNSFSIKTENIMGFIGKGETELNICSRFTHKKDESVSEQKDFFLHYMLEKVCHVNLSKLKSTQTKDKIFDFLPYLFPKYLVAALSQGLYKEYQNKKYNDSNVRGAIDVNRHIKLNIPFNAKIAYKTREYSFDNSVTELVRLTIEYLRSSKSFKHILLQNEETKDAVSKIESATPLYNRINRQKILSQTAKPVKSPFYTKYRDLQKICRMILLREKIKYDSSANKIYGILFDGAWLWEEYLWTILKKCGFKHPQNKKSKDGLSPTIDGVGRFYPDFYKLKPDTKESEHKAQIILDAKYKNFDDKNPVAADLTQMISYIHVMDAEEGKFIYPSANENQVLKLWTIKPFANTTANLGTISFFIPQKAENYSDFETEIKKSEDQFFSYFENGGAQNIYLNMKRHRFI